MKWFFIYLLILIALYLFLYSAMSNKTLEDQEFDDRDQAEYLRKLAKETK